MSRQHLVAQTIGELGTQLGIPDLALDDSSRVSLTVDGIRVTLNYAIEPIELLWLFVDLGEIADESTEVLEGLLQLGFLTWSSNSMTVGLDEDGKRALGYSSVPVVNLSLDTLVGQLNEMLRGAAAIRERIERNDFEVVIAS
jgi:hypothetical protein